MIEGRINDRYEPIITITVTTPEGDSREVEAVVDTGFNGFLSLPAELVEELGLPFLYSSRAFLADDRQVTLQTHQATINWDGQSRTVRASASGTTALVGMRLMEQHQLEMDVRREGAVRISRQFPA